MAQSIKNSEKKNNGANLGFEETLWQEKAVQTIIEQSELLSKDWAA